MSDNVNKTLRRPVALVTGGARRIGECLVRHLAAQGWDVALTYNTNHERAKLIASELADKHGARIFPILADFMDRKQMVTAFEEAVSCAGAPIQLLINNASLFEPDSIRGATFESWDRSMRTNFEAPFFLSKEFANQWATEEADAGTTKASGSPKTNRLIVNMIDQRVVKPTPQFASYTLAKCGLHQLTLMSAQAFAPRIRVNAIAPGPLLVGDRQSQAEFEQMCAAMPLETAASVDDVLRALDFLIASETVTGQVMFVDAGQRLAWQTPDTLINE